MVHHQRLRACDVNLIFSMHLFTSIETLKVDKQFHFSMLEFTRAQHLMTLNPYFCSIDSFGALPTLNLFSRLKPFLALCFPPEVYFFVCLKLYPSEGNPYPNMA